MLLVLRRFAFDIGNERYKINKNYEKIIFFCENICFFKKKVVTLLALNLIYFVNAKKFTTILI